MSRALSFLAEDAVYSLTKHQLGLLRWHWGRMLLNDTCHKLPPVPIKRFVVGFSDASLTHMGFAIFDPNSKLLVQWYTAQYLENIYDAEFAAAKRASLKGWEFAPHVILGCDNLDAVRSLQRNTSIRRSICLELMDIERQKKGKMSYRVFHIRSKENPADGLTCAEFGFSIKHDILESAFQVALSHLDPN